MKNKMFALIGAAGYIAPRHLKAIKETNNTLLAAVDKNDSVGILDSYFPKTNFFTEIERFDRYMYKLHNQINKIEYVSICTPNYLHDAHIRLALRNQANAICEKPLVLNTRNIEQLEILEKETGKEIFNIFQLRLHPSIIRLKNEVETQLLVNPEKVYDIDLTYLTSRGKWYFISWKGDGNKSGGISSNIGVHFFDMLTHVFGDVVSSIVHIKNIDVNAGFLKLRNANIRWFLSINNEYLPKNIKELGQQTYRCITIDDKEIEFSDGFTDLHTLSYKKILEGNGFKLKEAYKSIEIVADIRNSETKSLNSDYHPFCKKVLNV